MVKSELASCVGATEDEIKTKLFGPVTNTLPPSWEKGAEDSEDAINLSLKPVLEHAETATTADAPTEQEKVLNKAIAENKLDLTTKLGKHFSYLKSVDKKMKADYLKCKNKAEKDDFKLQWCQKTLDGLKAKRTRAQSFSNSTFKGGKHKPFAVIVRDEGADVAAHKAAMNIITACVALHGKGVTCGGCPFVQYNGFSKRTEFLHLESGYSQILKDCWTIEADVDIAPGNGNASASERSTGNSTPNEQEAKTGATPPGTDPRTTDRSKNGKKRGRSTEGASAETPKDDEEAAKARKKEMDANLAKCVKAKGNMDIASASCADLFNLVTKDAAWKWADSEALLAPLRKARAKAEQMKTASQFWRLLSLHGKNFPGSIKKQHDGERDLHRPGPFT